MGLKRVLGLSEDLKKFLLKQHLLPVEIYFCAHISCDFLSKHYKNLSFPDSVAVPDFSAGAMENWGLILYRETALLYNPEKDTYTNKARVAVVVAHELAHQVRRHGVGYFLEDTKSC